MKEIDNLVEAAKKQDEWRREYMTWRREYMAMALELDKQREEGRAEGLVEGEAKGKLEMLKELVQKGMLTIKDAAGVIGLSEESFRQQAML